MGQRVQVGPITYVALETQWKTQLKEGVGSAVPNNRFLMIRMSLTNSGGANQAVPLMVLVDAKGETHPEVTEGTEEVPQWLGLLRNLAPAQTEQGNIVFDVPMGAYKLKVSDGGDIQTERTALIDIPLTMEAPQASEN
jgi:hypothetical protein